MAKTKYMMHECAYCHKETKMERIGGMTLDDGQEDPTKVWYRCTRCKHSALITLDGSVQDKKSSALSIDRDACTEYSAEKTFKVGQDIYHPGLDDVGRVLGKDKTSGGSHSIIVSFVNSGERRLLEDSEELLVDDAPDTAA